MDLKIGYPTSTGSLSFMDILGAILSIFRDQIIHFRFGFSMKQTIQLTIPARDHQPRDFAPAFRKARPETTLQKEWW
jgi:hypothetical protein